MNMLFCGLKIAFFQNKASLNYLIMSDVILTRIMEAKKERLGEVLVLIKSFTFLFCMSLKMIVSKFTTCIK